MAQVDDVTGRRTCSLTLSDIFCSCFVAQQCQLSIGYSRVRAISLKLAYMSWPRYRSAHWYGSWQLRRMLWVMVANPNFFVLKLPFCIALTGTRVIDGMVTAYYCYCWLYCIALTRKRTLNHSYVISGLPCASHSSTTLVPLMALVVMGPFVMIGASATKVWWYIL